MRLSVWCGRDGKVSFSVDGDINEIKDDLHPNNEMQAGITMHLKAGTIVSYKNIQLFSIGHTDGYGCFIAPIQTPIEKYDTKAVFNL